MSTNKRHSCLSPLNQVGAVDRVFQPSAYRIVEEVYLHLEEIILVSNNLDIIQYLYDNRQKWEFIYNVLKDYPTIDELFKKIEQLDTNYKKVLDRLDEIEKLIKDLDIATLLKRIKDAENKVAQLSKEVTNQNDKIVSLENTNKDHEKRIKALEDALTKLGKPDTISFTKTTVKTANSQQISLNIVGDTKMTLGGTEFNKVVLTKADGTSVLAVIPNYINYIKE